MPRPKRRAPEEPHEQLPALFVADAIRPALPKTPQVYDLMRRAIVMLALEPGASINEKLICETLAISRTPLREALLQLSKENLVTVVPNSGTYVAPIDLQRLFDGQLVRDALETRVVQYAARKATPEFLQRLDFNLHQQKVLAAARTYDRFYEVDEAMHQLICEFGASAEVWKIVHGAKAQLDRVRRLAIPEANHLDIVLGEHGEIVSALHAKAPESARRAMSAHVGRVFHTIRHLLEQRSEFFAPDSRAVFEAFASLYERDSRS
jgi:DNA-binding GntR family transcriptional regulator